MSNKEKERERTISEIASLGGKALFKKYGKKHMRYISKKGVKARWGK